MPTENHITTSRTARYFTTGTLNESTKDIWILIHGHRQLAGDFIKIFEELSDAGSYLIAPEGLMRLYIKGDSGDVGASWMTKEDRDSDIKDYVNYLDKLFFDIIEPKAKQYNLKINALGFSQGSATLSRWIALGKSRIDKAVFWCGSIAHDVDYSVSENFKRTEIHQVFASNDPYYDLAFSKKQAEILTNSGIKTNSHIFTGGHEINIGHMRECNVI